MISFDTDGGRFSLRAAGIAIQDGHVLIHRAEADDFWALPGGRAELREAGHETLMREMLEETGLAVNVGRLVWIIENFFHYRGVAFHELGLYFEMTIPSAPSPRDSITFEGDENGAPLEFRWAPLTDLRSFPMQPAFLTEGLLNLPPTTERIVWADLQRSQPPHKYR